MADPFERLRLDPGSELTILGQIRAQLTLLIADGMVEPGTRLPPVRTMARRLGVNVNTVRAAYARLESDGVVVTRHGIGTIVQPSDAGTLAPSLPRHVSNAVGVLIGGLNPFYLDLIRGIETKADELGTLLFIVDAADSEDRAKAAIRQLSARGVQGIIAVSCGASDAALADSVPPIVYVDQPHRFGQVLVFNADRAAFESTEHLIRHGHRRIGYVTCPVQWPNQAELFEGYRRALRAYDLTADGSLVATVEDFGVASGRAGYRTLSEGADQPTAVLASGAMLAIGVLQEAGQRGKRVPDDLAIVGYGDVDVTQFTSPPLTMVALPTYEIGVEAMAALRRIVAGSTEPRRLVFDGTLQVRESCGAHQW